MENFTLLNQTSESTIESYKSLLNYTEAQLPYTVAHPFVKYQESLATENYGSAMNHAIDFCEISVQYLSMVLLGLMCRTEDRGKLSLLSPIVNKIDTKRPLSFGDWVNDIFIPLINTANTIIPDEEIVASLKGKILIKKQNIITGNKQMPSFVQIRNEYKGHSTTLSQEIYRSVVYTMESRLWILLEAMKPLGNLLFVSPTQIITSNAQNNSYKVKICNGAEDQYPTATLSSPLSMNVGSYYLIKSNFETGLTSEVDTDIDIDVEKQEVINLSPFVWCNELGYVYIFQTLKEDSISYISSNEKAITLNTDSFNEPFDLYLQQIVPSFDISKDRNWSEYISEITAETKRFIANTYNEKKYNKELFVDRQELSSQFEEFKSGDKQLFPILGEAGQGKTNQLCYWTESLLSAGECVATFSSNSFSNYTLDTKIKSIFGYNLRRPIKRLLDGLHSSAVEANRHIYIIFDAINECLTYKDSENIGDGALDLYRDIRAMFIDNDYTNFKIIFTCRSFTWKQLIKSEIKSDDQKIFLKDDEEFSIKGFTDDELHRAFYAYQELYQIEDRFEDLDRSFILRLKDPLMLKIACTNYLGAKLPTQMSYYSSIALFEKMLFDISKSYAGRKQCVILDKISAALFDQYRAGNPSDSIDVEELRRGYTDSTSRLHSVAQDIFTAEGQTVAYGELLHKPERPVLRVVETESMDKKEPQHQIQFIYERFLEYLLARTFIAQQRATLQEQRAIPASAYREALNSDNNNVVFMGAMRNAILIDFMATRDLSTIIELAENGDDRYDISLLVNDALNVMVCENFEAEVFAVVRKLMQHKQSESRELIERYNGIKRAIDKNQIDQNTFKELRELQPQISPLVKLRQLASITTINGIFQSDYFNEQLYQPQNDPYSLLWETLCDTLDEVRNSACLYIYYLSNLKYTLSYTPIKVNLTEQIVIKMYDIICQTPIISMAAVKSTRNRSVIFLEAATRLCVLLIIDSMILPSEPDYDKITNLRNQIERVFSHFTGRFYLIRVVMPFIQLIMRRQITFQSTYVNNAMEYEMFWDDKIVTKNGSSEKWGRDHIGRIMPFISHYNRYYEQDNVPHDIERFEDFHQAILDAYKSGDSLSYFILERVLAVQGICSWEKIRNIVIEFFSDEYRQSEWFDYSQMSMIYVLFQVATHSKSPNKELFEIIYRECEDWTLRLKGVFTARNSHMANPYQHYKRNVMSWYAAAYCIQSGGDNLCVGHDEKCAPALYKIIKIAFDNRDKELLYNSIENITELICDYGYIETGLELTKYILTLFDNQEVINTFNAIKVANRDGYHKGLVNYIGESLAAAKKYFPTNIDNFIKKDIVGLSYPGIDNYKEDVLNYNTGGETIADLITHKFGKFLIWSLIHEEAIDNFAIEAMNAAVDSDNCVDWYDKVIRVLFKQLFDVKL
ncbi:MAG: hypothetical protein R3Y44_07775 [Rikenellaceae bacterium]